MVAFFIVATGRLLSEANAILIWDTLAAKALPASARTVPQKHNMHKTVRKLPYSLKTEGKFPELTCCRD